MIRGLAGRARALCAGPGRAILGITGAPGAGKTTLVEQLLATLLDDPPPGCEPGSWVAHVPMDGFHLADVQLERLGLRDRKGAPETFDSGGNLATLRRIRHEPSAIVYVPGFERHLEQPIAASIAVQPAARLVITEGNYLLLSTGVWPFVRAELDEVWYVDAADDERVGRLVRRHVEFGKTPDAAMESVLRSDEANAALVAASRPRADLVLSAADL